jgi:hypothetical protein
MFAVLAALAYFIAFFQRAPLGFDLVIAGHLGVALHLAIGAGIPALPPLRRRRNDSG